MARFQKKFHLLTSLFIFSITTACSQQDHTASFSLLPAESVFQQNAQYSQRKIDILWVVDNSGSMATSQSNVALNFQSFIQNFQSYNYDFQMAVTTSDAYRGYFLNDSSRYLFKDGSTDQGPSGYRIITPTTPNIASVFMKNIIQGTNGYGDERAFASFFLALGYSENQTFLRDQAFLSIIIISDEDDFSSNTETYLGRNYSTPPMHPISEYVDYLTDLKKNYVGGPAFSVSAVAIFDQDCLTQLTSDQWKERVMGIRYGQLADATQGIKASLCSQFGESLKTISDSLISLTSQFPLDRIPVEETIRVFVNGVEIPEEPVNGWSYNGEHNTIVFHGTSIPPDGANIDVKYDPTTLKL